MDCCLSAVGRRCALALTVLALASSALAATLRPGDRLLLVSTRAAGCSTSPQKLAACVRGAEYDGCAWREADAAAALAALDPSLPTVFYIHGNQITADLARRDGLDVYRRLTRCGDDRPVQLVVFSWCSDKVPGLLRDFREKAARTEPVGWQLAWTINQLPPGAPVGVIGYSYGARVSTAAAHLLAGGSLGGLSLPTTGPRPMRAVLLAAAMDACWLADNGRHGAALDLFETTLVTANPSDPAMRLFRFSTQCYDPEALGECGPGGLNAADAARVCVRNVSGAVGRSHDLREYLSVPGLMSETWRRTTFADAPGGLPTVAATTAAGARQAPDGGA